MTTNMNHIIIPHIKKLIEAENDKDPTNAKHILSTNFEITRARGEEQKKEKYLFEVSHPKNPNLKRQLEEVDSILVYDDIAVGRSIVTTIDIKTKEQKSYRNTHIFINNDKNWECILW
jgi:hypothetical protein